MKFCENEFVIFSLAVPRSRTGNYWIMNGPLDYEWSIPVGREVRQKEVSCCFNDDDI